jgi:hypothetical protein
MSTYKERLEAEIIDLRDTLDAARRQRGEQHRLRRKAEATIARVEALADLFENWPSSPSLAVAAKKIRIVLAGPERDEEGGR